MNVKPADGKLGVLCVGLGAVTSTFMTGVLMARKGLAKPVGSMTQYDKNLDKGKFRIRLNKIDAPEKKQAFGNKAKQYLSSLIFGKQVSVRFKEIDRYGRISGVIYCDGAEINLVMVQNGYAWHYSYYDKTPAYIQAEKQARADKKGLWAEPKPINPYEFRKMKKKR